MTVKDVAFISSEEDLMVLDAMARVSAFGNYFVVDYCVGLELSSLNPVNFQNLILWEELPPRKEQAVKLKRKYGWGKKTLPPPNIIPKDSGGPYWLCGSNQVDDAESYFKKNYKPSDD